MPIPFFFLFCVRWMALTPGLTVGEIVLVCPKGYGRAEYITKCIHGVVWGKTQWPTDLSVRHQISRVGCVVLAFHTEPWYEVRTGCENPLEKVHDGFP